MQSLTAAGVIIGLWYTAGTFCMNQEKDRTDQLTKAIEHLRSDHIPLRLMGIYTLERIARDSERDYTIITGMLTSFLRERTDKRQEERGSGVSEYPTDIPADIQAALTVLARRIRSYGRGETQPLNLSGLQLQAANLGSAQLQRAFLGGAQLQRANLEDTQLQRANLEDTQLQRANLIMVENLTQAQINQTCIDENTQLPEGLIRPAPCPAKP
jgi:hypothetical protein